MLRIIAFFILMSLLGCAKQRQSAQPYQSKLDAHIGIWNYKDVLRKYGPPNSQDRFPDGTSVARWTVTRSDIYEIETYDPKDSTYKPAPPAIVEETLRMTFDRNGILQSWKQEEPQVHSPRRTTLE